MLYILYELQFSSIDWLFKKKNVTYASKILNQYKVDVDNFASFVEWIIQKSQSNINK